MKTEKNHIKKFKELKKESKSIIESLRFNSTYLSLPNGHYKIDDVLKEVNELKETLIMWKKEGWQTISPTDKKHTEIIPVDLPKIKKK